MAEKKYITTIKAKGTFDLYAYVECDGDYYEFDDPTEKEYPFFIKENETYMNKKITVKSIAVSGDVVEDEDFGYPHKSGNYNCRFNAELQFDVETVAENEEEASEKAFELFAEFAETESEFWLEDLDEEEVNTREKAEENKATV